MELWGGERCKAQWRWWERNGVFLIKMRHQTSHDIISMGSIVILPWWWWGLCTEVRSHINAIKDMKYLKVSVNLINLVGKTVMSFYQSNKQARFYLHILIVENLHVTTEPQPRSRYFISYRDHNIIRTIKRSGVLFATEDLVIEECLLVLWRMIPNWHLFISVLKKIE